MRIFCYFIMLLLLNACVSSNDSTPSNTNNAITIDNVATVPVILNNKTSSIIYVHNNSKSDITGIQYVIDSQQDVSDTKDFKLDGEQCSTILANSSCMLKFTTPILNNIEDRGSALISANYYIANQKYQSQQIINYEIINSSKQGIYFSQNIQFLSNSNPYATIYLYALDDDYMLTDYTLSNDSYKIINEYPNNKTFNNYSVRAVEVGLINELLDNVTININALSSVSHQLFSSQMIVGLTPSNSGAILTSGFMPVINTDYSKNSQLIILNSGNGNAFIESITMPNATITTGINSCTNLVNNQLASGASCTVYFTVSSANGSQNLTVTYNNSKLSGVNYIKPIVWYSSKNSALLGMSAMPNPIVFEPGESRVVTIMVNNLGVYPFINLVANPTRSYTGNATYSQQSSLSCGSTLSVGESCSYTVIISDIESEINKTMLANVSGAFINANGQLESYSRSLAVPYYVFESVPLAVVSSNPVQNGIVPTTQTYVVVKFNTYVDTITVNPSTITLTESNNSNNLITGCSYESANQFICQVPTGFEVGESYTFTVTTGVKSISGGNLSSNYVVNTFTPIYVEPQYRLATAASYSCMLNANTGKAYCWGYNADGELGNATINNSNTPVVVSQGVIPVGDTIISINAGTSRGGKGTTCAITTGAKAYCWGDNQFGAVGDGTLVNRLTPVAIATKPTVESSAIEESAQIVQISASNTLTCALDSNGQAYCWGNVQTGVIANFQGYLGDIANTQISYVPIKVNQSVSGQFIQISAGGYYACGLTESGNAYCWGNNYYGTLGNGQSGNNVNKSAPTLITSRKFKSISASKDNPTDGLFGYSQQTCGIGLSDSKAYCWGGNLNGALGIGESGSGIKNIPTKVFTSNESAQSMLPDNVTIKSISAGSQSTCAIDNNNIGYCWGLNNYGQLGIGSMIGNINYANLVSIGGLSQIPVGVGFQSLYTGFDNGGTVPAVTCGLATNNKFYCWGSNSDGQVGVGTSTASYIYPQEVIIP